ncbi:MAG: TonB-dependent receptor [Bacteroidetes bacterium]|nr:TonB-dependent receptor [Bacteroidota bacterium]
MGQQQTSKDSVKTVDLNEVCIHESADPENQSFNFYKSSKLATTEDILSRMEGVNLIRRGAYGLEPTIRNYSAGQTNITIDGMRIYGACTDKMDPVSIYIEPVNLQSIQVAHGAAGALNGSTIGGQINFNLKEPDYFCNKKLHGQFSQSYATVNNGYNTTASLQQTLNKFSYRISGALRDADNYRSGSGTIIQNSGYHKSNVSTVLAYKIDSLQSLKLNYLGDWGKNIGYPALPMDVGLAKANIASLTHQLLFKGKYLQANEAKVYYNSIYHQMDDTHRSNIAMHMDMPGWSTTYGFYNNISTKKDFNLRLDYHRAQTRADMVMYPANEPIMYLQTLPENIFSDMGLAMSRKISLKHKQQVGFNARVDYISQSGMNGAGVKQWEVFDTDITEVKRNVLKNFNLHYGKFFKDKFFAKITLGYGERVATSNERYGYYLFNRQDQYDYLGNLSLKPEKSFQSELLFRYASKKAECSLNFFYHHTNDYIYAYRMAGYSQMTPGALGLKTYTNIAYAESRGGEMSLKYYISEKLTYIGTAKYVYALTNNGTPLPLVPPLKLQQALRYAFKFTQIQLEYDYAASQKRVNQDYGDKATPDFHLLNFRVSHNFKIKYGIIQIGAACENILNANYREHLDIGQVPRFGRNFTLNLSVLF